MKPVGGDSKKQQKINDGTVAAITSDGTTAWTAVVSTQQSPGEPESRRSNLALKQRSDRVYLNLRGRPRDLANYGALPDFQGGLILSDGSGSITKLDGITGQPYPSYTYNGAWAVHPDGGTLVRGVRPRRACWIGR